MIKHALLFFATACSAVPLEGVAQSSIPPSPLSTPALPPPPPAPPSEPSGEARSTRRNRSDVFLGVETTSVPAALSDQLNLPDGFGLLVDYVVPRSPAEASGVKTHDILQKLNDQILTSEEQLSVLVRSFAEGQAITLVILRKGQEATLTATLQKRQAHEGERPTDRNSHWHREGQPDGLDSNFHFEPGDAFDPAFSDRLRESIERSRAKVDAAAARAQEQARKEMEIARERAARATGSRLDLDDAHILLRDSTGRIEIRFARGKRVLTLRDAEGKKSFEGPIDTPEQRKAIPVDILPKVEVLEREQIVTFPKGHDGRDEDDDSDGD